LANSTQSYKSHVRWLPPFHFFVIPVLLINAIIAIRRLWLMPNGSTAFALLVALALLMLALVARAMAVTVQDRVIRLEMRLRLRDGLPADLRPSIDTLTRQQLVALRFASDAEMPGLVRDVLAGKLTTTKAIKLRIKDWQGDHLRA
jgi:hypothetical protein